MVDIHQAIRKKFGMNREVDNLPWGTGRKYNRYHLAQLFGELGFNEGAEIGVRRGAYSIALCKANPNLHLRCIDPWEAYSNKYTTRRQELIYQEAVRNLAPYHVTIIRKRSLDALGDVPDRSLDFIFIDGHHGFDYAAPDIIFWSKKVKSGGIVSVHDYYAFGWSGVVQAVNGYVQSHHIDPWYCLKEYEPTAFWVNP
jgi:hypothetical protein